MPSDAPSEVKFEIGHVLFIDIVGYSKLLINEQSEQVQKLKEIVRGTEQVRLAEQEGKLLRLPTGDGGALVFRNSPEAPVLCALEMATALQNHPELRVRMGIHSGPVNEVTDLNAQANIAGAGINIAQRVMDCGDAGHILVSRHVAEDLEHYPRWQPFLHELGQAEVKHGHKVSVVNLFNQDFGNPELPEKFKTVAASPSRTGGVSAAKRTRAQRKLVTGVLILAAVAAAAGYYIFSHAPAAKAVLEKSVAVLPFENLSDDKSNAYFADGIQDEILTKLASIADLKVISRTSTAKYKSKPEDLKTVSQQLGVANVVEGTVQRAADKVRVNVQLIDARADSHLWAKTYDRDIKDVFAVESEVAQEIADSLQAKLSPAEAKTLATAPTKDTAAYDLFLKGEFHMRAANVSLRPESFEAAIAWYKQAIARDPNFALAMARLAECRLTQHWFIETFTEAELAEVKKTAEHALALAPDLAETHVSHGLFYYYGYRQYEQALAEFGRALQLQPNNAQALEFSGLVYRRQGQWQRCLDTLKKSLEQDPRNADVAGNLSQTYCSLRMWQDAERRGKHALGIDPSDVIGMRALYLAILNGSGDIKRAQGVLAAFPSTNDLIS